MNSLKGLAIIGFAVWLLFLGGISAIQRATTNYATNGAPIIPAVATGANRLLATPAPLTSSGGAPRVIVNPQSGGQPAAEQPTEASIPTETPIPATPTQVVVVPSGLPEAAQQPTETPYPTVQPAISLDGEEYAVHEVVDKGYKQDCVYIYTQNKRVCWSPGIHPSDSDVQFVVRAVKLGQIAGEPIPN